MIHEICLMRCDDWTVFEMDLNDSELSFIKRMAVIANNTSTYGCMPTILIDDKLYKDENGDMTNE